MALKPKQVVEKWIAAFNEGNADKISELYHPDAVNHQVANEPVEGIDAIRKMFETEFNAADMTCIPENVFEDGEWASETPTPPLSQLLSRSKS